MEIDMELKSFIVLYDGKFIRVYKENEADKEIAEKDKTIADLIEKNKRLANKDIIMASETIKGVLDALRHQKFKRCLAMARWCDTKADWYYSIGENFRDCVEFYIKWRERWKELADQFNPNSTATKENSDG